MWLFLNDFMIKSTMDLKPSSLYDFFFCRRILELWILGSHDESSNYSFDIQSYEKESHVSAAVN